MNLETLASRQEEMHDNWAARRKGPISNRIVGDKEAFRQEAEIALERMGGSLCYYCKKNEAVLGKRAGELKPCKPCTSRANRLRVKYRISKRESYERLLEHLTQDNTCLYCKERKAVIGKRLGESPACKSCTRRAHGLRKYYGISLRDFYNMVHAQLGRCAICCDEKWLDLVVDQCHDTGHIRGLLCVRCNSLLGIAKDKGNVLENASKYIRNNMFRRIWIAKQSSMD